MKTNVWLNYDLEAMLHNVKNWFIILLLVSRKLPCEAKQKFILAKFVWLKFLSIDLKTVTLFLLLLFVSFVSYFM